MAFFSVFSSLGNRKWGKLTVKEEEEAEEEEEEEEDRTKSDGAANDERKKEAKRTTGKMKEKVHVIEEEREMKGEKSIYLLFSVAAVIPRVCLFSCPSVPKLSLSSSSPQLPSHTSHFLIFCFFFFLFFIIIIITVFVFLFAIISGIKEKKYLQCC